MVNTLGMVLVVVKLEAGERGIKSRTKEMVPKILAVLQRIANNDGQLAFTDNDGATFGYLLESPKPLHAIRSEVSGVSGFTGFDSCLVIELTGNVDGVGFSRAWNWMSHRQ